MRSNLITDSRSASFKLCRKKHYWEYEVGIRPTTDAKALRMGSAGHIGLAELKRGYGIDAAVGAIRGYYCRIEVQEPEQLAALEYECETVVALVNGYAWRWGQSEIQTVATEQVFRLPLVNPATFAQSKLFELAGKIDGIVTLEDGRLAVVEHKFLSDSIAPGSDLWPRLQLDHQITLYVYAARELGHKVSTVLYDIVRKPSIKPTAVPLLDEKGVKIVLDAHGNRVKTKDGKKFRETGDAELGYVLQTRPMNIGEWSEKLTADISDHPEVYYARQEIARLDQDIEEYMEEVWDIQNVLREAQRNNRWFKTVNRNTCPYCPYFGLCTSKYEPAAPLPEGFEILDNVHPELEAD